MSGTTVQLRWGLLRVRGDEARIRRSVPVVCRGIVRWLRNVESPGSALARGVLGTSAAWSTVAFAPDALQALEDLSLASLRASASISALAALLTVAVLARRAVVDASVSLPAVDRVEVDEGDRELTVVSERERRWLSDTRERTLRPVSEAGFDEAVAAFRRRGIDVEPVAD